MKTKVLVFFIILLFLFLRFYRIEETFFFQNDIGRDFVVLDNWKRLGDFPLLGPQNSAIPFNQSAIYFYLLFPFYFFLDSVYSTLIANAFIYISLFLISLKIASNNYLKRVVIISFLLLTISPQIIFNNRYVLNPSLVPPFLLLAVTAFLNLYLNQKRLYIWIFSASISAAIAFSYSSFPILLSFLIVSFFVFPKIFGKILLSIFVCLLITNTPTILFELRYSFVLTKALLNMESLGEGFNLAEKLKDLVWHQVDFYQFSYMGKSIILNSIIVVIFLLSILFSSYLIFKKRLDSLVKNYIKILMSLYCLSFLITLLVPFKFHFYYVGGLLTLALVYIASLPLRVGLIFILILVGIWMRPAILDTYFTKASRTIGQLNSCLREVCKEETKPIYVTVQSGHPYHSGLEFRYLMRKQGCKVWDIENTQSESDLMAVVADGGMYQHNKTKYYELEQFGDSSEIKRYNCQDNLQVHILRKK